MFLNEHRNHWYSTGAYFWSKNLFEVLRFSVLAYFILFLAYYGVSEPDVDYWYQAFWEIPHRFLLYILYFYISIYNFQGKNFWLIQF